MKLSFRTAAAAFATALLTCLSAQWAEAQMLPQQDAFTHVYARPGYPTITVFVWGAIGNPGVWKVEPDVDMIELLSAAHVPGVAQDQPGIERRVIITIYRTETGERQQIYSVKLEDVLVAGQDYPLLREGDIVEVAVKEKTKFSFRQVVQVVTTLSTLTVLYLQIFRR